MNSCKRCGTCCKNGGPALHNQDLHLFKGHLQVEHCITIRKSEPAFCPLAQAIAPSQCELLKIAGQPGSWQCLFYNETQHQCAIYLKRPIECGLLQCWNTKALTEVIYQETLCRTDVLSEQPLLNCIGEHEEQWPYELVRRLAKEKNYAELTAMINGELHFRQEAVTTHDLSLPKELFCFGRPLFKSASFYGIQLQETANGFQAY